MGQQSSSYPKLRMLTRLHSASQPARPTTFQCGRVSSNSHAGQPHQRRVGNSIFQQPSASSKPAMSYAWAYRAIVISLALFVGAILIHRLWIYALALFLAGWTLQFIGHAFERKEPEFFHDWRFLFVGVRWWWAKIRGKA